MVVVLGGLGLRSVAACSSRIGSCQWAIATPFVSGRSLSPTGLRWQHTQVRPAFRRPGFVGAVGLIRHQQVGAPWRTALSTIRSQSTQAGGNPSSAPAPATNESPSAPSSPPEKATPVDIRKFLSGKSKGSQLLKLIALAGPEKKPLSIAITLLFISSAVSLSIPFTVGKLIDYFTGPNVLPVPFGLSQTQVFLLLVGMFSIGALANAGRSFLMRLSGQRIVARLRERIFSRALQQEVAFMEKGEGDVISRLSVDTSIVGESLTQNLSDGLRAVAMASVGLGAMFYLSPTLTTLMLAIVPPVSLGAVFYGRYLKRLSRRTQEAVGDMTNVATESLSALRTVQAFNAYTQEETKFGKQVERILTLARKEAIASGMFFGATGWSGNVTLLCLLGYGSSLVSQGIISMGDLTSLLLYTVYVGSGLQMLTSFFTSIVRGLGASSRIFELLDRKPEIDPAEGVPVPASTGNISFEGVSFAYPSRSQVEVLKDFNLKLNMGDNVAIVGKSGSGKSSVHSLLLRLYDPTVGRITFNGQDIRDLNPKSWRNLIGVVPQDPVLFTGTIAENIAFGQSDVTLEQIKDAARHANCDFIYDMPNGFDTKIGRLSLSGGQRQRIAIARALLKRPSILLLDEATSALDTVSEQKVIDAIDRILSARDTICITVAHRLSTISQSDQVILLEGGKIVEHGNFYALMAQEKSHFRALVAAQIDMSGSESLATENKRE